LFLLICFPSRRRHTSSTRDWSSDVCSSDLTFLKMGALAALVIAAFVLPGGGAANFQPLWPAGSAGAWIRPFGVAMIGVLWAYDEIGRASCRERGGGEGAGELGVEGRTVVSD